MGGPREHASLPQVRFGHSRSTVLAYVNLIVKFTIYMRVTYHLPVGSWYKITNVLGISDP